MKKCRASSRILVIGAGVSGIAAATRLLQNNFGNVQILEAENRIGGRIYTVPFGDNVIDLGAQWCYGQHRNSVYEMVKDTDFMDFTGDFFSGVRMVRSNKEVIPLELGQKLYGIAAMSMPKESTAVEESVGSHLAEHYWQEIKSQLPEVESAVAAEALEFFSRHESSILGSDNLFDVSGRLHLELDKCSGDQLINWRDKGFAGFLRLLMKVSEDEPTELGVLEGCVRLGKKAVKIELVDSDQVRVVCEDGDVFNVDHVICTASLGVLQEQHERLFNPPLSPAKVKAIQSLQLGTVDKLFLEFKEQPFPDDFVGFFCLWREEEVKELRCSEFAWLEGITGIHKIKHQPRLLLVWIGGLHGRRVELLTDNIVLSGLQWLFGKFLSFEVPPPDRFLRSKWFSNPNFRGSYSYRTMRADELDTGPSDLALPVMGTTGHPRLLFAGEATSQRHFSTVHGATEAGFREADRLIEYYSSCE
ncbi:spermine oxidase [Drosophila kikkawai]|uniref:Spermine oxidase n=1 Tax=Drosophila kikkawai TaxID=30033 RepID=A0A6P4IYL0_DROKI|nr:spermine oxidase [Drosophila kikkawai]